MAGLGLMGPSREIGLCVAMKAGRWGKARRGRRGGGHNTPTCCGIKVFGH